MHYMMRGGPAAPLIGFPGTLHAKRSRRHEQERFAACQAQGAVALPRMSYVRVVFLQAGPLCVQMVVSAAKWAENG